MKVVAEIFLCASLELLFDKSASSDLWKYVRQARVHAHLKKWEKTLQSLHAVLSGVEKQRTNRAVKLWLDDLKDLVFDVDDVLDELATMVLQGNLMAELVAPSVSKLEVLNPACFSPSEVMINIKMGSKIEEITDRFEEIASRKRVLELRVCAGGSSYRVKKRLCPTSLLNESDVLGMRKDKEAEAVLKKIFSRESSDRASCVIPIIGLGRSGKTMPAHLMRACVSEDFDVIKFTKIIMQSVASEIKDVTRCSSKIELPSPSTLLKQCFAYCSIFPKDYEFKNEQLSLVWMADGFLQQSGEKQMKDLGHEYF